MDKGVLSKLDRLIEDRKEEIRHLRSKGVKVVGYLCSKTPVEIIRALGMVPVRLGEASEETMAKGKEFIHQFTCPYIKCIVGEMMGEKSFIKETTDVLAGYVTCLAVHRCLEVLKLYTGKPTYYITHPLNPPKEREERFYAAELRWFTRGLEKVAGLELDAEGLNASVGLYNRIRERLREIYRMQALNGPSLMWSQAFKLIQAGFFLDPDCYLVLLEEFLGELDSKKGRQGRQDGAPRLMLSGSPILPGDEALIKTIEESGARIVADTLCTGLRTFEDLIIEEPSLEGIAWTYLNSSPCATAQDLDMEKDRRLNHMLRLIREYRVDGVIYYALRFCDHYAFKDDETREYLSKRAGVPLIAIHSEYGEAEVGRLRTRIEGFLEALQKGGKNNE